MKHFKLSLLFMLVFVLKSFSQNLPQQAPLDADFMQYRSSLYETQNFTDDGYPLGEIPSPANRFFDPHNLPQVDASKLGAEYDLRDVDGGAYLSPVRDQGLEGACWAFATYGAVESYWLKNGMGQEDFSEQNMATCHGFDWTPSEGGNYDVAMAYLARRSGPIDETADPYTLPTNPDCVTGLNPVAYIDEARYFPGINDAGYNANAIKQNIMDNGAMYVNMRYDGDYMNYSDETYYYNGTEGTNHGVLLVGWDDDKTVTGGSYATPSSPGAWIIRNSWGPSWGESGYFYISYEDTKALTTVAYFPSTTEYNNNSDVYGYDELGWCNSIGYSEGDGYALVKFTSTTDQSIQSIGTFVTTGGSNVDIEIYDSFDGSSLSTLLGSITGESCDYPGYYSFDLGTPINLSPGNDFYVKVRYYNSGNYSIPVEIAITDFSSLATFETGKCWVSNIGTSWTELGGITGNDYDVCIKAYATDLATTNPVADFTGSPTTVAIGADVQFTDNSTGVPSSWTWTFEGADQTSSNLQHPTASWSSAGTYDVTLSVTNAFGTHSITKEDYITVVNAPVTCQAMSNVHTDDNIVYYTATDGYVSGQNGYGFTQFAEYFENPVLNSLTELTFGVARAEALSSNPIVTIKVWDNNGGIPGTELYSEDKNISDFTAGSYNTVTLSSPVIVPEAFFVGYEVYYETTQDTFAVYMAQDREDPTPYTPTAFTYYSGSWGNLDDVFSGGINTAYVIDLELCPAAPVVNFESDETEACETLTVQFTDLSLCNPDTWSWNFGDGNTSNNQHPIHTYNTAGDYTVTLTATNSFGSDTYTITEMIHVYDNPSVNLGSDIDLCPGVTSTLDAGAGMSNYAWTPSGSSQTLEVSTAGTYAVTITDNHSCTASDEVEVNILTAPTVDLGGDIEACSTQLPINLDAGAGMASYTWSPSGSAQSIDVNSSGTYSVVVEDASGCTATDEVVVNILPEPTPEFSEESIVVCSDATPVLLDPDTDPGYYYAWSDGSDTETIEVSTSGTYSVTVSYGTCTATDEIDVEVIEFPQAYDLMGGGEIDEGSDAEIYLSDSELDVTYYLSHDVNGVVATLAGTGEQLSFGNFTEAGTYTASAETDVANCTSDMNGNVQIIITSLANNKLNEISVYPNPVANQISIHSEQQVTDIKLYSADGKLVMQQCHNKPINVKTLENGLYFIEILTNKQQIRKQIIISK